MGETLNFIFDFDVGDLSEINRLRDLFILSEPIPFTCQGFRVLESHTLSHINRYLSERDDSLLTGKALATILAKIRVFLRSSYVGQLLPGGLKHLTFTDCLEILRNLGYPTEDLEDLWNNGSSSKPCKLFRFRGDL